MRRVAVVGAGALGTFFAAALARTADVWLLGRRPEWAARAAADGIACEGLPPVPPLQPPLPGEAGAAPAANGALHVTIDPQSAGAVDVVLLTVKSYQTESALPTVAALLAQGAGAVLSVQNGLAHVEPLTRTVGWDRLLFGTCTYGVTRLDDIRCRLAGQGLVRIGTAPAAPVWPEALALLRRAGLAAEPAGPTLPAIWQKALVNAGINPLTALLGVTNGALADAPAARSVLTAAVREGEAVARAAGVALPDDMVAAALAVARQTAANVSSMLQDVRAGRPTEIDAINGELVRLGQQLSVATPVNEALVELVQALAARTGAALHS